MNELHIKLNFNPGDFWEMYYPDGPNTLLRNNLFQKIILYIIITAAAIVIIYFISFRLPIFSWLIAFALLIIIGLMLYATFAALKFFKRKNDIKSFLKDLSQYNSFYLTATNNAVEIGMDSKVTIDKWENISSAQMNENYIQLFTREGPLCIFPAKSMTSDEFDQLKEFIKSRISADADVL